MLEMAASAASAAAKFAVGGGKSVTADVQKERMATCHTCKKFEPVLARCGACGCFLSLKTWLPKEKCPLGKW